MLRLCLDLNIWVAALLADRKGRSNTASQYLVEVVRNGDSPVGETSLVISWGMREELRSVIVEHLGFKLEIAQAYVSAVEEYAKLGAQWEPSELIENWQKYSSERNMDYCI